MEQFKSLQDSAYREIKRRIMTLVYRPGQQINTAQICQQLHIGRTPVHLAIHRLERERLIEIQPRRGITVRPVDGEEIRELIEARMMVEPELAALAARRGTEREFGAMRGLLDQLAVSFEAGNGEEFMRVDTEFHRMVAAAARNQPLSAFLVGTHERCLRAYFMSVSRNEQDARVMDEHEAIIQALIARDGPAAAAAMRRHIESLSENLKDVL
ncbi:MAG: GntR family transcriptional regulator [Rhodospirillaceae bacterium]|nr:GntR family transcriptional regulator [Rhodospirillaceae bacterium]